MHYVVFADFLWLFNLPDLMPGCAFISSVACVNRTLNHVWRSFPLSFKKDGIRRGVEVLVAPFSEVRITTADYEMNQETTSPIYLHLSSQTPLPPVRLAETWVAFKSHLVEPTWEKSGFWCVSLLVCGHMGPVCGRLLKALWCRCFECEYVHVWWWLLCNLENPVE